MFKYNIAIEVPINPAGRDFALADLHGCYDELRTAMAAVNFDPAADRIFCVGDLVDRGPHSLSCMNLLREPWFFSVQGNHENMMMAALKGGRGSQAWDGWMVNGGEWFAELDRDERALMKSLLPYVSRLPITLTVPVGDKKVGIAHAQPPKMDWHSILDTKRLTGDEIWRALWGREHIRVDKNVRVEGVDVTIHGHTIVRKPLQRGNMHFIDTGAYLKRRVTLWEIETSFLSKTN